MVLIRRNGMDAKQIKKMGRKLEEFLGEFDDCFGRSGPREHLRAYGANGPPTRLWMP